MSALNWQRETMQADLQLRNADLSAAESQLLQLKNGARPQEIQEAQGRRGGRAISIRPGQERLGPRPDAVQERRYLHFAVRSVPHAF